MLFLGGLHLSNVSTFQFDRSKLVGDINLVASQFSLENSLGERDEGVKNNCPQRFCRRYLSSYEDTILIQAPLTEKQISSLVSRESGIRTPVRVVTTCNYYLDIIHSMQWARVEMSG